MRVVQRHAGGINFLKGAFLLEMESRYYRLQYRLQRSLNLPYFSQVIVLLFLLLSLSLFFTRVTFALQAIMYPVSGGSFFLMTVWLRCPEKKTMRPCTVRICSVRLLSGGFVRGL